MTSSADISRLLNKRITVGSNTIFVHTYMYKASGRLHDALLAKLSTAFFGALPAKNPLSSNAHVTLSRRQYFAPKVDERRDYYHSSEYSTTWRNCCHAALREVISVGVNASRNIRRQKPDIVLPDMPKVPPVEVSVYFLVFIALKVSSCVFISILHYLQHLANYFFSFVD